jgi:flagellar hook-associated protein 1 FlgK
VNTDEELAKLIELEAAFAASARVLQTVQQSLDELVNIIR